MQQPRPPSPIGRLLPERTIVIRSRHGGSCLHLGPASQAAWLGVAILVALWLAAATATLVGQGLAGRGFEGAGPAAEAALAEAYERRIAGLEAARAQDRAALADAEARLDHASEALARRHDAFAEAAALAAKAAAAEAARAQVASERAAVERERDRLAARLAAVERDRDDLAETLGSIATALEGTAGERDAASAEAESLERALAALTAEVGAARDRRAALLAELERAAALSIEPLETMLATVGVDVDAILGDLRAESETLEGVGGPFVADEPVATPAEVDADRGADAATPGAGRGAALDVDARSRVVLAGLERVRLLRDAAGRLPFATPVRAPRFTSGFGSRRDPINGRRARHDGLDMAGPVGTPVLSPAEGVVTFAGTRRGYGRMVEIRHDFGVETVYAHLSGIRVAEGARVSRGARIGDMGSSGRSTGSHLHYEVHVDGRPVDPMTFIKAARHVL